MSELTPIVGISQGQANRIIYAYTDNVETNIFLDDMDLHFFSKRKKGPDRKYYYQKCLTIHTRFLNIAIFDYTLLVVGKNHKRKLLKIKSNKDNNESLSIFVV